MTSYQNADGEFLMTAAEARFEADLDASSWADYVDEYQDHDYDPRMGCGTGGGCEYHDGECAPDAQEPVDLYGGYEDAAMSYNFGLGD